MSHRMWGVISHRASWLIGYCFTLTGVTLAFSLMTTRCRCFCFCCFCPCQQVFVDPRLYIWCYNLWGLRHKKSVLLLWKSYECGFFKVNIRFPCFTFRILLQLEALVLFTKLADHILGHSLSVKKLGLWRKAVDTILMMKETIVLFSKNSADQEYKTVSSVMRERGTLYSSPSGVTSRNGKIVTPLVLFIV